MSLLGPGGGGDPSFDPNSVDPAATRRTAIGQAVVLGVIGGVFVLVKSSGKEFGLDNAPGRAEQAAKKEAEKKASLAAYKEKTEALKAAAGR